MLKMLRVAFDPIYVQCYLLVPIFCRAMLKRGTDPLLYGWTDGSFRRSAGLGWYVTLDSQGSSQSIAQGFRPLGPRQTPFDAELAAILAVLSWFRASSIRHMVIRSDPQSAIARASHTGPGPGQGLAKCTEDIVCYLPEGRTVEIAWIKGHSGIPGMTRRTLLLGPQPRSSHPAIP